MTVSVVDSRATAAISIESWLATRSGGGPCTPGAVILHAPSFAFQAPGGGENQLIQTGMHLEETGRAGSPLFAVDRPPRDGPAAPSFRDVARGARAGADRAGASRSRRALADLLV